jgi:hypothetical protein
MSSPRSRGTPGCSRTTVGELARQINGIDVSFNGFDAYDVEPGKVPDLFASRPIVMFGKWRGRAAGSIDITGKTGRAEYQRSIAVSPSSADTRHGVLRHLWARTRIADLSDFGPSVPSEERVAEITSLGLSYGLLRRRSWLATAAMSGRRRQRLRHEASHR